MKTCMCAAHAREDQLSDRRTILARVYDKSGSKTGLAGCGDCPEAERGAGEIWQPALSLSLSYSLILSISVHLCSSLSLSLSLSLYIYIYIYIPPLSLSLSGRVEPIGVTWLRQPARAVAGLACGACLGLCSWHYLCVCVIAGVTSCT